MTNKIDEVVSKKMGSIDGVSSHDVLDGDTDIEIQAFSEKEVLYENPIRKYDDLSYKFAELTNQRHDVTAPSHIERIAEDVSSLNSKIENLHGMFEHKLAYDITKQQQIDNLHSELQKYKSDLIAKTAWPIINGLIQMYGHNNKRIIKINKKGDEFFSQENFIKEIEGFQEDIEILLEQNGVLAFSDSEVTDEFSPQRQRALETTKTDVESLQGKVAKCIRAGFEQGEKIIQKEFVNVYVYDESLVKPGEQSDKVLSEEQVNSSDDIGKTNGGEK